MLSSTYLAFLVASLVLALIPGPGVIYIVTRTLQGGRRAGLASIGGIALGNFGNASLAAVGLAAVIAASTRAFVFVKIAGAAYLIFLGINALRRRPPSPQAGIRAPARETGPRLFRDGFLVALLNPKTALFFAALLPQFADTSGSSLAQNLGLGLTFVAIAMCTDTLYALSAAKLAATLQQRSHWSTYGRYVSAAAFIGLGLYAACASPRAAR
jgi:threonine/homoserine/homoserine lactone efflux protein